ncbi:MAG: hypothetical protein NCW75_15435 [Phycisphaera sp.]|nr:MAG: hypothetical protein NCW75_15435 [Phycisphaera sp.]
MTDRPNRLWWAVYPPLAVARELAIPIKQARAAVKAVQKRRRILIAAAPAAFAIGAFGWLAFLEAVSTIYNEVNTFHPDGSLASTSATGPFGTTTYPLLASAILGYGVAWLIGVVLTFVAQDRIIGTEARRCARTPACFACGYDLSAVVGDVCPECGTARVGEPPARIVSP